MKRLFILLCIFLTSCSEATNSSITRHRDYSEISHLTISYLDVFKQSEKDYYLYYYQTTCYHCLMVKDQMIDYAINSGEVIYFVSIKETSMFSSRGIDATIGTNDPLKAFSMMTPQLSYVKNSSIVWSIAGDIEILSFIEE